MNYFLETDNYFIARGRLAKEPRINVNQTTGNIVVGITLAQNKRFKDEQGNPQTVFIDYMAHDTKNNTIASRLAEYTTKGALITLQGYHDSYKKGEEYIQVNKISDFRVEDSKEQIATKRKNNLQKEFEVETEREYLNNNGREDRPL